MKFVTYSPADAPEISRPGILFRDDIVDLRILVDRLGIPFLEGGSLKDCIGLGEENIRMIRQGGALLHQLGEPGVVGRDKALLRSPLPDTRKLIMLAGNYIEHIREVGFRVPPSGESITPQFFMKPPSTTIIGPEQPIHLSRSNTWVDWEVELAVVISKKGRYISVEDAMDHVFGYTIVNDISEREFNSALENRFQREKDPFFDWLHGKWFDGFAPMGPCISSKEEIPDPHKLELSLYLNGTLQQKGTTEDMLHPVSYLIHKLSEIMTVEPGDVIATGTPSGVGHSKEIRLKGGDELLCHIERIGYLRNPVAVV